jgi:glycosyltransferase involved in cell wall biosynthesis
VRQTNALPTFKAFSDSSVSVIIPTFNRAHTLHRAIDSVTDQTQKNLEIIIVDDGSTDDTPSIVAEYTDCEDWLTYVRLPSNMGAQGARMEGVRLSRGRYVVFLDSDDALVPDSILERLDSLAKSGFGDAVVYGDVIAASPAHSIVRFKQLRGASYHYLTKELSLCPYSTILVPRRCLSKVPLPSADFPSWQDDDMVLTLGKVFPMLHCGQVVAVMHASQGSITQNRSKLAKGCKMMVRKYRRDIIMNHGGFRLILWDLRVLLSYLLAAMDDSSGVISRNWLIRGLLRRVCGVLNRVLRVFFDRIQT